MVDVARSAVTGSPRGLFINLAIDCDTMVAGPGGTWKATLRETADGFTVRLEPAKPVKAEVRIHRREVQSPGTQDGSVEAPKGLKVKAERDAWVISGTWGVGQELRVHLPTTLRVEMATDGSGILLRGHDMLVAHSGPANAWLTDHLPAVRPVILWSSALPVTNGRIVVPASLAPDADPDRSEQWHPLELTPLRVQGAARQSQVAWFSFQPRPAKPEGIAALLANGR
jgi:hypothetical protein